MNNTNTYSVKEFCKKYNARTNDQIKNSLIDDVMNPHYVSYEMKITICEKIVESSYYTTSERDGIKTKKFHSNSPVRYMLYCLNLIKCYTYITVDFNNALDEFNLLNKSGLLDILANRISEKESKEFRMILDMVESDIMQNEYETHSFISNQVERFGELLGHIIKPAINSFGEIVKNMDEKAIDKMANKITEIKEKFTIVK